MKKINYLTLDIKSCIQVSKSLDFEIKILYCYTVKIVNVLSNL